MKHGDAAYKIHENGVASRAIRFLKVHIGGLKAKKIPSMAWSGLAWLKHG